MARVAFHNVTKYYDEQTLALQKFSLTIKDGELLVLVGPSGCGKSTALRILAGLEEPTEGEILINDNVVNQTTPQQRNIAMVFQNYALYPHMTVQGNLVFPLKMTHSPANVIEDKVKQIAEILDLCDLLDRKPKQLSGGQRQRVAMGRALVRDPSVFLLDEPLSNLDAKLRAQIRADIAQIQKRLNKTTLYVTHDQVEAMTLGDRVAVMNGGQLQQVGTPEELYAHPQNIFVARFIGSPGMNIIPATLRKENESQFVIEFGQQTVPIFSTRDQVDQAMLENVDKEVYVGVRPESFYTTQADKRVSINIRISSVEYLGHESLIYFNLVQTNDRQDEEILIARIPGQFDPERNSADVLYIDPAVIFIFNKQSERVYIKKPEQPKKNE